MHDPNILLIQNVIAESLWVDPVKVTEIALSFGKTDEVYSTLISYWINQGNYLKAKSLVDEARKDGLTTPSGAMGLLKSLNTEDPAAASEFFRTLLNGLPVSLVTPDQFLFVFRGAREIVRTDPNLALLASQRIMMSISVLDFPPTPGINGSWQIGEEKISTEGTRQNFLLPALAFFAVLDPDRFAAMDTPAEWKKALGKLRKEDLPLLAGRLGPPSVTLPQTPNHQASFEQGIRTVQRMPIDFARARAASALLDQAVNEGDPTRIKTCAGVAQKTYFGIAMSTDPKIAEERKSSFLSQLYEVLALTLETKKVALPSRDASLNARLKIVTLENLVREKYRFRLSGSDGRSYDLISLRGKVVLLNFWATWCLPCRKELPEMGEIYNTWRDKGLEILAISDEPLGTIRAYLRKVPLPFPVLSDPKHQANIVFGVTGLPSSIVLDRKGLLVSKEMKSQTQAQLLRSISRAGL